MSQTKKILLGIGIVGALCLCAGLVTVLVLREAGSRVANAVKTDPADIAEVSSHIAEFDVPPGYETGMAMSLFNYETVTLMPGAGASTDLTIMMMQFTGVGSSDPALMEKQLQEAMSRQTGQPSGSMTTVEQRTEVIRGEEVTVTISESASSQGYKFRQWMTVFAGNKGPTILMIQGSTNNWDDELIADFIQSIH